MKIAQWKLVLQALAGLTGLCCAGSVEAGEGRLAQSRTPGGVEHVPMPPYRAPASPSTTMPDAVAPRMPEPMNAPPAADVPDAYSSPEATEPEVEMPAEAPAEDAEPPKDDAKKSAK